MLPGLWCFNLSKLRQTCCQEHLNASSSMLAFVGAGDEMAWTVWSFGFGSEAENHMLFNTSISIEPSCFCVNLCKKQILWEVILPIAYGKYPKDFCLIPRSSPRSYPPKNKGEKSSFLQNLFSISPWRNHRK